MQKCFYTTFLNAYLCMLIVPASGIEKLCCVMWWRCNRTIVDFVKEVSVVCFIKYVLIGFTSGPSGSTNRKSTANSSAQRGAKTVAGFRA